MDDFDGEVVLAYPLSNGEVRRVDGPSSGYTFSLTGFFPFVDWLYIRNSNNALLRCDGFGQSFSEDISTFSDVSDLFPTTSGVYFAGAGDEEGRRLNRIPIGSTFQTERVTETVLERGDNEVNENSSLFLGPDRLFFKCSPPGAASPDRLCFLPLGGTVVYQIDSTSYQEPIYGDDPQAFITHTGRVCYTAHNPRTMRKLYCLSGNTPVQVGDTNPAAGDDPAGLLSTTHGLLYAAVPPGLGGEDKKLYLSTDLKTSSSVPSDEEYRYSTTTPPYIFP